MTQMTVETLALGEYHVGFTPNGRFQVQLHRDASNAAHVDVFNASGICDMGRVMPLLEAELEFASQFEIFTSVDLIKAVKEGK
jgi:hypothetical protein